MSDSIVRQVLPALRMLASREVVLTLRLDNREIFRNAVDALELKELPFIPDDSNILVVDETTDAAEIVSDLEVKLSMWKDDREDYPDYILIRDIGLVAMAENAAQLNPMLGYEETKFPVPVGRLFGKIAIVTGAAMGFGAGIAELLFHEGANMVIADWNEEEGQKMADFLNNYESANRALFVKVDVSNAASVENLVLTTVKYFGGLDLIVSNAGVLRAGGLDEMTPENFDFMTDVNYKGYFLCAKYSSAVMKIQSKYRKNYFTDIIQINSKSGLAGSNKNFAYAGGKFGGIGLTQSFAMELMPFRIKVNSICPGNFFEGPLWSDPEKGLFVQYLRAGKIPGAKTIEDVKAFYESKVPAGRGCRVIDVYRAILYVIEQEYETGQAVPVTGGQVMLN
ncbi:MAG: SDR family NAD(P)-dependent oxidoreductase [Prolixibacteraceae bacterium]